MDADSAARLVAPLPRRAMREVLRPAQVRGLLAIAEVRADDADPVHLRDRAIPELLYATGIQVSESVGLDVGDLDWTRCTVRATGKGGRERIVPFGIPAARAVREWLEVGRPA